MKSGKDSLHHGNQRKRAGVFFPAYPIKVETSLSMLLNTIGIYLCGTVQVALINSAIIKCNR